MGHSNSDVFWLGGQCEGSLSGEENVEQESAKEILKKGTRTPIPELGNWAELKAEEPTISMLLMDGNEGHGAFEEECCTCCRLGGETRSSMQGDICTQLLIPTTYIPEIVSMEIGMRKVRTTHTC